MTFPSRAGTECTSATGSGWVEARGCKRLASVAAIVEDFHPGAVGEAPPGLGRSDAPQLSLDGDWRFRLVAVPPGLDESRGPTSTTRDWDVITCPRTGCCTGDGRYGRPIYTNVQYPFPSIRRTCRTRIRPATIAATFELPDWDVERVLLRFDGVESVFRVWLNGEEVGVGKGSRLVQEFDVTDAGAAGSKRDHGPGAPVVVDELPRGPRSVVAAGDLPRRHPARPAGRRDRRCLAATGYASDGTGRSSQS